MKDEIIDLDDSVLQDIEKVNFSISSSCSSYGSEFQTQSFNKNLFNRIIDGDDSVAEKITSLKRSVNDYVESISHMTAPETVLPEEVSSSVNDEVSDEIKNTQEEVKEEVTEVSEVPEKVLDTIEETVEAPASEQEVKEEKVPEETKEEVPTVSEVLDTIEETVETPVSEQEVKEEKVPEETKEEVPTVPEVLDTIEETVETPASEQEVKEEKVPEETKEETPETTDSLDTIEETTETPASEQEVKEEKIPEETKEEPAKEDTTGMDRPPRKPTPPKPSINNPLYDYYTNNVGNKNDYKLFVKNVYGLAISNNVSLSDLLVNIYNGNSVYGLSLEEQDAIKFFINSYLQSKSIDYNSFINNSNYLDDFQKYFTSIYKECL